MSPEIILSPAQVEPPVHTRTRIGLMIAGCGVAGATLSAFVGIAGGYIEVVTDGNRTGAVEELAVAQTHYDELEETRQRVPYAPEGVSEECVTILGDYFFTDLAELPEETRVNDLLAEDGTPCGDEPREVRVVTIDVATHIGEYSALQMQADNAAETLADERHDLEAHDQDASFNGANEMPKWFVFPGLALGLLSGLGFRSRAKKANEYFNRALTHVGQADRTAIQAWPHRKKVRMIQWHPEETYRTQKVVDNMLQQRRADRES